MASETHNRNTLSASTMIGDDVRNPEGENLGSIKEIMLDVDTGRIAYAVLDIGGFLGIGNKLFAMPWAMLSLDTDEHEFVLNVPKERLENAPGFDQDDWPDFSSRDWGAEIYTYYDTDPYWS